LLFSSRRGGRLHRLGEKETMNAMHRVTREPRTNSGLGVIAAVLRMFAPCIARVRVTTAPASRGHDSVGKLTRLLLAIVTLAAIAPAYAQLQPIESVTQAAIEHLRALHGNAEGRLEISARPPDSRLRLAACDAPLLAEFAAARIQGPNAAVRVRCPGAAGWSVNVMLDLRLHREVLVTARSLARGNAIAAVDLRSEERDVLRLPYGYVTDAASIEGVHTSRMLAAGTVIHPGLLAARLLVERGRPVTVIAASGNIDIRATATALENGIAGAQVRVRNLSSGRIVTGIVQGPGVVVVAR
jgi:flagella basal body P-ring formation protein FlgA